MILKDKVAVVYGAGGVVGSAVAGQFARQGARVFLTGPTLSKLEAVHSRFDANQQRTSISVVDALDAQAVEAHAQTVVHSEGRIDISFNAMGKDEVEIGVPLTALSHEEYLRPLTTWARSHFITTTTAGRIMSAAGSGTILTLSSSVARMPTAMAGGFLAACTTIESLTLQLAAELGPSGVRVLGLRPAGLKESVSRGSITREVWGRAMERMGMTIDDYVENFNSGELLPTTVSLAQLASTAAFLASDRAGAMTATMVNVSCGQVLE